MVTMLQWAVQRGRVVGKFLRRTRFLRAGGRKNYLGADRSGAERIGAGRWCGEGRTKSLEGEHWLPGRGRGVVGGVTRKCYYSATTRIKPGDLHDRDATKVLQDCYRTATGCYTPWPEGRQRRCSGAATAR